MEVSYRNRACFRLFVLDASSTRFSFSPAENSDDSIEAAEADVGGVKPEGKNDSPVCYMCFDEEISTEENPLVTPCKCNGGTKFVHGTVFTSGTRRRHITKYASFRR